MLIMRFIRLNFSAALLLVGVALITSLLIHAAAIPASALARVNALVTPAKFSAPGIYLYSSPTLGDVTGDSKKEIVVGTDNGIVRVLSFNGTALSQTWEHATSPDFGSATTIRSVPVVADLDNNGSREVVVSVGDVVEAGENGGVIVLNSNGSLRSGWPQQTSSYYPPHPASDGIVGSPAVGDIDRDGRMEIVAGALDRKVYAWNDDGTAVPGWPVTLIHTTWASPALADLDKDGYLEVILSTDVGKYEDGTWSCPYPISPSRPQDYCGGSVWVFRHDGTTMPGFPVYTYEMMQSSTAVADINGDGWLDIVAGTGTYYSNYHQDLGYANKVYAWDHYGNLLTGWPVTTASLQMPSSPVIGDIDNDSGLEIVIGGIDYGGANGKLYAFNPDGTAVPGFPMTPLDSFGFSPYVGFNVGYGVALADYDGSDGGKQEIVARINWHMVVIDGNGTHLTDLPSGSSDPSYIADNGGTSTPAVGDIDNDGKLEMVSIGTDFDENPNYTTGIVYAWNLDSTGPAFWGTMHRNERNTRLIARVTGSPASALLLHPFGAGGTASSSIMLYTDGVSTTWSVSGTLPADVILSPTSGSLPGIQTIPFSVDPTGYPIGTHSIGTITLRGTITGELTGSGAVSVPVTLVVGDIRRVYLPLVLRNH